MAVKTKTGNAAAKPAATKYATIAATGPMAAGTGSQTLRVISASKVVSAKLVRGKKMTSTGHPARSVAAGT